MQSSGYTPLSAFGKPIANPMSAIEDKINLKTPIVATTDQEGISGEIIAHPNPHTMLICFAFFRIRDT